MINSTFSNVFPTTSNQLQLVTQPYPHLAIDFWTELILLYMYMSSNYKILICVNGLALPQYKPTQKNFLFPNKLG